MRTTVTLDADVEHLLRETMHRQHSTFKQTLNDALRRGLGGINGTKPVERFRLHAKPMGLRTGLDPTRIRDIDDDLEIEQFRRKTTKLKSVKK